MDPPEFRIRIDRRIASQSSEVRFIPLKEVLAICGLSRSSLYAAVKKGEFPGPVRPYGRSSRWVKTEVEQWARSRVKACRPG